MEFKIMRKKFLSVLLIATMLLSFFPLFGTGFDVDAHAVNLIGPDIEYLTEGNFTYFINRNGYAEIVNCDSSAEGEVEIPSVLGGASVAAVLSDTFDGCENITSLKIPESIKEIERYVLGGCTNLERITVDPANQNYCSDENGILFNKDKTVLVFFPCKNSLTSYEIPDSVVEIGPDAFNGSKLDSIKIPDSVKTIADGAFSCCSNITSIYIPGGVTSIGIDNWHYVSESETDMSENMSVSENTSQFGAFRGCTSLEKIIVDSENKYYSSDEYGVLFDKNKTELIRFPIKSVAESYEIPDSVSTISCSAFNGCNGIRKIKFGKNVKNIDMDSFGFCDSFEFIEVDTENNYFSSDEFGVLYNKDKSNLILYPDASVNSEYAIPDGVATISGWSFYNAMNLYDISIPDSVVEIGDTAFVSCGYWIERNNWKNGLLYIDNHLVGAITHPTEGETSAAEEETLTIKEGTLTIAGGVFRTSDFTNEDDPGFVRVNIPASLKSIGEESFMGCSKLEEVNIPGNSELIHIYHTAFRNCIALKEISLPDSLKYIGDHAFASCNSLKNVNINKESELEIIGESAFWMCCSLEQISVSENVKKIGLLAFDSCENLKKVNISKESKLEIIDISAFSMCYSLEEIYIPASVVSIGDYAFENCGSLKSLTIEKGGNLKNIGNNAFSDTAIESVCIPENVSNIGLSAFTYCNNLQFIDVDDNNQYYSNDGRGVLFNKDKTRLIQYPTGRTEDSYVIERGIIDISSNAFAGKYPENLHVPLSVTTVSDCGNYPQYDEDSVPPEVNSNYHIYYEGSWKEFIKIKNVAVFDAVFHPNSYGQNTGTPETPDEPKELVTVDGKESPVKIYPEDGAYEGEVFVDVKEVDLTKAEVDELEAEYARISANTAGAAVITYDIKVVQKGDNGEYVYADINNGKKVRVKIPVPNNYDKNKDYVILHKLSDVQNENNKIIAYIGDIVTEKINGKEYFVIDVKHFSKFTIMEVEKKSVASVSIANLPAKTSYIYKSGDIDLSGIALTVTYSDGTTETVTDTSKMTVKGFDSKKTGNQSVTVEYEGATASFDVSVSYAWWQWIIRILLLGFLWY